MRSFPRFRPLTSHLNPGLALLWASDRNKTPIPLLDNCEATLKATKKWLAVSCGRKEGACPAKSWTRPSEPKDVVWCCKDVVSNRKIMVSVMDGEAERDFRDWIGQAISHEIRAFHIAVRYMCGEIILEVKSLPSKFRVYSNRNKYSLVGMKGYFQSIMPREVHWKCK